MTYLKVAAMLAAVGMAMAAGTEQPELTYLFALVLWLCIYRC